MTPIILIYTRTIPTHTFGTSMSTRMSLSCTVIRTIRTFTTGTRIHKKAKQARAIVATIEGALARRDSIQTVVYAALTFAC